jgi:hypothetical protein
MWTGEWADGRTDMMKLTVSFRNFAEVPKERLHKLVSICRIMVSLSIAYEEEYVSITDEGHCKHIYLILNFDRPNFV